MPIPFHTYADMTMDEHSSLGDMPPEEFLRYADKVVRWIGEYLADPERYPVLSRVEPGEITRRVPGAPPMQPEPMEAIWNDFESLVLPGITHWNHPDFFAYFAISASSPGILAEAICSALNVNGMLWKTSPVATELEEVVVDWLRQMLGLPDSFRGMITDTASISSLLAIAAARERIPGLNVREQGLSGRPDVPRLRLYTSEQAHSSIEKAAITLGIGQQGVRKIPTDSAFRMDTDALALAIEQDLATGWLPFCVVATVGTTSTTSVDPVPDIAAICLRYDLWLHVDGAYGGSIGVVPEFREVLAGCELADSMVVNPHKWLFTPIDCSVLLVKQMDVLKQAFALVPDYLMTASETVNYMDYGVQLGRRFRALKLWMVIRYFGQEGLAARIREHVRLARLFAEWVDASPDFERMAPVPMSVVCFRAHPPGIDDEARLEQLNSVLMNVVNATGEMFISHTRLNGRFTLRLAIGNIRTQERHVVGAWEILQQCLPRL